MQFVRETEVRPNIKLFMQNSCMPVYSSQNIVA